MDLCHALVVRQAHHEGYFANEDLILSLSKDEVRE